MPLPADETTVQTATKLVKTLQSVFSTPPGYRPAHAHGLMVKGVFTPSSQANEISSAPHFQEEVPVIAPFSSSTGIPAIPDTDANANPRGIAIRFVLSEDGHKHTDIIAHSTSHFPMRTGAGFLSFLQAIGNGTLGDFFEKNPSAKAFVEDPKPSPRSFATEMYYGVNAFKLVSSKGKGTFVRYRLSPRAGESHMTDEELKSQSSTYLFDEFPGRLASGPVMFKLLAQVADESDVTDDATVHWPQDRQIVELGTVTLRQAMEPDESTGEQKTIIYDPIPRVDGVEASADPLLEMRAAMYLISGKERRAA